MAVNAPRRRDDRAALMRLVAELYHERGLSQQEIAELAGLSVATVSRLLRDAKDNGLVVITVVKDDTEHERVGRSLSEALGIECWVTTGHSADPRSEARLVGAAAAPVVADRLPHSGVVGWASGHTIAALVTALRGVRLPGLSCVQLVGGWDPQQPHLDAGMLVRTVSETLGARSYTLHAPAVFDSVATKQAVLADSTLRATIDMWDKIDVAVISSGGPPDVRTNYFTVMDRATEAERRALQKRGVVGDALGHLFDINGEPVPSEWSERTITMPYEKLAKVPSVIAVLGGQHKVRSVIGLARTGIPKLLVTDMTTAESSLALLAQGV